MRSSKSRSRGNKNRSRHSNNNNNGNNQNRVFDSSGPEGKVRGTPQQIIDKYNQLARDAALSNDSVAVENFQQHAEHYTRMLAEAQREADARRDAHEAQNRERQQQRDTERKDRQEREGNQPQPQQQQQQQSQPDAAVDPASAPQPDMRPMDAPSVQAAGEDTGLVETPESKPAPRKRTRRKPAPKPVVENSDEGGGEQTPPAESPEAAE